jgi:Protein of unknown function (DUF3305)
MSRIEPLERIRVGVVVERCRAKSEWTEFVWRPSAVLPGVPETLPWTVLETQEGRITFYAGAAEILLYRSDSAGYRDNLRNRTPMLWVALRPTGDPERSYKISAATVDPGEGEAFSENAGHLVEALPMPEVVRDAVARFVAEHHVERPFIKRQRDRANLEAMAATPRIVHGKV